MDQFLRARAVTRDIASPGHIAILFVKVRRHSLCPRARRSRFWSRRWVSRFSCWMIAAIARSRRTPWFFEATAGAFVLTEVTYLLGNFQTYRIYRLARDSEGISEIIKYSWWLRVRLGVSALIAYGWLYASLGLVLERPLLVGGALGNWCLAAYLWWFRGAKPRKVTRNAAPNR